MGSVDRSVTPYLAGYRIYWRLTIAPEWNHSRFVSDLVDITLENLIIDHGLFGASSESNGGFESLVVLPEPAVAFFGAPEGPR